MTAEEQYKIDKESHDTFIRGYQACINDAHRVSVGNAEMTIIKLLRRLDSERSKRESMDAPNKPGYFRANND